MIMWNCCIPMPVISSGVQQIHLRITENGKTTRLTFSGDVGRYRDVILRSPAPFDQADFILLESTYGNSLHDMHTTTPDMSALDRKDPPAEKRKAYHASLQCRPHLGTALCPQSTGE